MKKIFLTLVTALVAVAAWAVEKPKQGFGIQIGWAQPVVRLNSLDNPTTAKDSLSDITRLNGFKIGLTYDASYIAGFGSSIGLNYTFAGGHSDWRQIGTIAAYPRTRTMTTYHEMEIFVDWQYKFEIAKETYLMLYTGPSIQCGIAFNTRTETQEMPDIPVYSEKNNRYVSHNSQSEDPKERFDSNNDLKRLNVTWGVGAGFQYKRYFLRGGYDFGLINPFVNSQFYNQAGIRQDRYTRGRIDQWAIKVGVYLWYND